MSVIGLRDRPCLPGLGLLPVVGESVQAMRFVDPNERPYFLWNERTTVAQFREALATSSDEDRAG